MIDGYKYVCDLRRLEIRVKEENALIRFLIVKFSEKGTVANYRLDWEKSTGRFQRTDDFYRFKKDSKSGFEDIWSHLTTLSLGGQHG